MYNAVCTVKGHAVNIRAHRTNGSTVIITSFFTAKQYCRGCGYDNNNYLFHNVEVLRSKCSYVKHLRMYTLCIKYLVVGPLAKATVEPTGQRLKRGSHGAAFATPGSDPNGPQCPVHDFAHIPPSIPTPCRHNMLHHIPPAAHDIPNTHHHKTSIFYLHFSA